MELGFKTRKLKSSITKVNAKVKAFAKGSVDLTVYGVTKNEGVCITGNEASEDLSEYIVVEGNSFAYNPYRVNIGSIGLTPKKFLGVVSPAYVVFKTNDGLNSEFLLHYLKSKIGLKLINWYGNRGGVRNALSYESLGEIDIPDLTISQQLSALEILKKQGLKLFNFTDELTLQQTHLTQLRQSILQDAVSGKLQIEPIHGGESLSLRTGADLLKQIKAEKEKLLAAGKLKKEKPLPPITKEEIPFELPKDWAWCRLGEVVNIISGVTLGKTYKEKLISTPYLRVANVQRGYVDISVLKELAVPKTEIEKYSLQQGDILMIEGGDWDKVGRCAIWNNEVSPCIHQNHIYRLRFGKEISNRWAELFLNSPIARRYFESCSKQTTNLASINKTQLTSTVFPLPPFAIQQAIVKKMEQLMGLCNRLQKEIETQQHTAEGLMQAVLREAFEGNASNNKTTQKERRPVLSPLERGVQ